MLEAALGRSSRLQRFARRVATWMFVLLVAVPLAGVAVISNFEFRPEAGFLEVEMQATGGTAAQLFWTSTWAFSHEDSTVLPLGSHPGTFERLRFPLPSRPLEFVRFDPLDGPGEVVIRRMQVIDVHGRTIRAIDPTLLTPLHQIAAITREEQNVRVVTTPGANDPMLLLRSQWLLAPPRWHSAQFVTPFSLTWIALAVSALVVVGLAQVGRDVAAGPYNGGHALWFAALLLTVLAAKLTLLRHYPMPVPFWDQWDGELAPMYLPFTEGGLTWRQMFTLHNEHRIFFTRVLAMVLLSVNGQWDPQLQIVVNIGLHAITAVLLAAVLWLAAGRRWLGWIVVTVALAVAPPFALENTLAGFQSAFYFLLLFSVLSAWLLGAHRPGSPAWLVGWLCAFCTIFTVAGGLLSVVAVGGVVLLKTLAHRTVWRESALQAAALALVAMVGVLAKSPPLASHDYLAAGTFRAFRVAFERGLAFPWLLTPGACLLVWLPVAALTLAVAWRRFQSSRFEQYVLGFAGWVVLQAAAVAYSRGANGAVPASRYLDMLSIGFVVNTMALLYLTAAVRRSRSSTIMGWAVVVVWVGAGALGISWISEQIVHRDARERRQWMREYVRNVRQFVVTGDASEFGIMTGPQQIPYHTVSTLIGWLRNPYVRSILPVMIRAPLPMSPREGGAGAFQQLTPSLDPVPPWDSGIRGDVPATGQFESEPLRCTSFHRLRFEVVGDLGTPGLRLAVKEVGSGRQTAVRSASGARGWRSLLVRCPAGPFTVVAEDTSPTGSFAFRAPTEVGWASAVAERLVRWSAAFTTLAAGFVLLALVYTVWPHRRPRPLLPSPGCTDNAGAAMSARGAR